MITLRRLGPEDAERLSVMGAKSLLESHGQSAPAEVMQAYVGRSFSVAACRAELADAQNVFAGVFVNGEMAGYFKIIFNVPHPAVALQPATKLERLYLLKEFYGLKLGHRLLAEAVDLSKAQGDKGMWLEVWTKNERAVRFYERQRFETVGEGAFVLTEEHKNPIWVMVKGY